MSLGARQAGDRESVADREPLDRLNRADRHRQAPVEALLPGDVRAQPRQQAERLHLKDAPQRLVGLAQRVDLAHHLAARLGVQAAHRRAVDLREVLCGQLSLLRRCVHRGDLQHVRMHDDAERTQKRLAQTAARDAGSGLAG
jgi:hypothetical protein